MIPVKDWSGAKLSIPDCKSMFSSSRAEHNAIQDPEYEPVLKCVTAPVRPLVVPALEVVRNHQAGSMWVVLVSVRVVRCLQGLSKLTLVTGRSVFHIGYTHELRSGCRARACVAGSPFFELLQVLIVQRWLVRALRGCSRREGHVRS